MSELPSLESKKNKKPTDKQPTQTSEKNTGNANNSRKMVAEIIDIQVCIPMIIGEVVGYRPTHLAMRLNSNLADLIFRHRQALEDQDAFLNDGTRVTTNTHAVQYLYEESQRACEAVLQPKK